MDAIGQSKLILLFPLIAAMLYGFAYAMAGRIFDVVNVPTYIAVWGAAKVLVFVAFGAAVGEPVNIKPLLENKQVLLLACLAITALCLGSICTNYAIKFISPTYAAIVEISYPLFIPIFAYFILAERQLDWSIAVGGALILAGTAVVILGRLKGAN